MPQTKAQRAVFALLTVLITVHAYVFYSLYVVNGAALTAANNTSSVLAAIANQGGILLLGKMVPIWAVVLVEFVFAFSLEMLLGSRCPSSWPAGILSRARRTLFCLKRPSFPLLSVSCVLS